MNYNFIPIFSKAYYLPIFFYKIVYLSYVDKPFSSLLI